MRFITILLVLAVVGWLASHEIHGSSPNSAAAAQQVVNGARSDLQKAQATGQAAVDQQVQTVDTP